jgi:hypothetical protein
MLFWHVGFFQWLSRIADMWGFAFDVSAGAPLSGLRKWNRMKFKIF